MRGPFDDAIAGQQDQAVVEEEDLARAQELRPPGGKPLSSFCAQMRLASMRAAQLFNSGSALAAHRPRQETRP